MGATGDLAQKKLFPAIYRLLLHHRMGENVFVVGIGRKEFTKEEFLQKVRSNIPTVEEATWKRFAGALDYYSLDFTDAPKYAEFAQFLAEKEKIHGTNGNRLFHLATLPENFHVIAQNLSKSGLVNQTGNWCRVVFEKPFGKNKESAKKLNKDISKVFTDDQIFRIDHYLGKELVQNIEVFRFANPIISHLWNNQFIDHVQINLIEDFGVENRAAFYDSEGALRDVAQNHLLQMLSLVTMDTPKEFTENHFHTEKIKILKKIKPLNREEVVLGQYEHYMNEPGVKENSKTETFSAFKLFLNHKKWKDVPFYLRTGKNLAKRYSSIYIQFKKDVKSALPHEGLAPNYLVIQIQPDDGIVLQLNGKLPHEKTKIKPVKLTFCHKCLFGINTPEAYETLLYDAAKGDKSSFLRHEEIEHAWKIMDPMINANLPIHTYSKGSFGPAQADALIEKDNRKWFNHIENVYQGL